MSRVILHIGQPKTGTSSIQVRLHRNREKLSASGVLYPKPRYIPELHRYLVPIVRDPENVTPSTINAMGMTYSACRIMGEEERLNVLEQFLRIKPQTTIFSTESLFGEINPVERGRLQNLMGEFGSDLTILAYLRNPVSHYISQCQQRLKICRQVYIPRLNFVLPVIEAYAADPRGRVECRAFDRQTLLNGDVVSDFLDWANIEVDLGPPQRAANESMSAEAMSALGRLGLAQVATTTKELAFQKQLVHELRNLDRILPGGTKPMLNPVIADFLIRTNTDLLELRDRYGVVFSDLDYSIVGKTRSLACPDFGSIESICEFDRDRRDALEAAVKRELNPTLLSRAVRRLGIERTTIMPRAK